MVQLINISQEQLINLIAEVVKKEISKLSSDIKPQPPSEWLSREEASKLLKVSYVTLRSWHIKGVLTAYSIGNRVYYKHDEVTNALKPVNYK